MLYLSIAGSQLALADTPKAKPDPNAAAKVALQAAQKVYVTDLSYAPLNVGKNQTVYTTFLKELNAWGRFQLTPTTEGADLVLIFNDSDEEVSYAREFTLSVLDPKTLTQIGELTQSTTSFLSGVMADLGVHSSEIKVVDGLVNDLKEWVGNSRAISAASSAAAVPVAAPPPKACPTHNPLPGWKQQILNAQRVLIVDDSQDNPGEGVSSLSPMFQSDLGALKHYEIASGLQDADLVFQFDFYLTAINNGYDQKGIPRADTYAPHLKLLVLDPKTLNTVACQFGNVRTGNPKMGANDPFPIDVQAFVNRFIQNVEIGYN